jgi:beta-lactamase superfamily II metal-dependent hydrolase
MVSKFLMLATLAVAGAGAQTLDIYSIDTEGGKATLIVTPSKQSLLIDAGYAGLEGRDTNRILAAAKKAGLTRIDYMFLTHYHGDHIGGIEPLSDKIPIGTFLDHGPNHDTSAAAKALNDSYARAVAKGKHIVMKPGDKIPLDGVDFTILASDGSVLASPLSGAGADNPACASTAKQNEDTSPNAMSAGFLLQFGKFRVVDLGDLTWNKEISLVCPVNQIGSADLFISSHHGLADSNSPALMNALRPRVAVMNNGARKGWSNGAWQSIRNSTGLEDLYQLHFALAGNQDNNAKEAFIANMEADCKGFGINVSAQRDGSFTVTNERDGTHKTYTAR